MPLRVTGARFEPGVLGIAHRESVDDAKALGVAFEAAGVLHALGEDLFGDVTEWRMAQVVAQRGRLGRIDVELVDELDPAAPRL